MKRNDFRIKDAATSTSTLPCRIKYFSNRLRAHPSLSRRVFQFQHLPSGIDRYLRSRMRGFYGVLGIVSSQLIFGGVLAVVLP